MIQHEEYQGFVQRLQQDGNALQQQYQMFSELQTTVAKLQAAALNDDVEAQRRLSHLQQQCSQREFQQLQQRAEKELGLLNTRLDQLHKALAQTVDD
ncbi:gp58-like family protein [Serratia quinivorans]|uniref:gp58-like family protein n=1 Tax=Serratia quinivorans TaxID=137545 RepID=UPI002177E3BB|nr:gp58-like family protein [Serratia quinivorans]CAI1010924.1 Uncharacterised protein [Serratia quinivorans]CAI1811357.1 Uncharacterised protein [Serratia quinivorans]